MGLRKLRLWLMTPKYLTKRYDSARLSERKAWLLNWIYWSWWWRLYKQLRWFCCNERFWNDTQHHRSELGSKCFRICWLIEPRPTEFLRWVNNTAGCLYWPMNRNLLLRGLPLHQRTKLQYDDKHLFLDESGCGGWHSCTTTATAGCHQIGNPPPSFTSEVGGLHRHVVPMIESHIDIVILPKISSMIELTQRRENQICSCHDGMVQLLEIANHTAYFSKEGHHLETPRRRSRPGYCFRRHPALESSL